MARTITLVALIVLAALLFLPPVTPRIGALAPLSPWSEGASLVWTPYLCAAALAIATAIGWERGPRVGAFAVGFTAIIATSGVSLMTVSVMGFEPLGIASLAVLAATVGAVGIAVASRGWARWYGLLVAWAVAALPCGCPRVMGIVNEFAFGLLFVIALGVLAAAAVYGRLTNRDPIVESE